LGLITYDQSDNVRGSNDEKSLRSVFREGLILFQEVADEGEELDFGPSLSKYDRLIIHEICDEFGIGHRSQGVDGIDRKLIAYKKAGNSQTNKDIGRITDTSSISEGNFSALVEVPDLSDSDHKESSNESCSKGKMNSLLTSLARDREARAGRILIQSESDKKSSKARRASRTNAGEANTSDVDEMSFLDEEIKKVQTSHGVKFEGKGQNYRTIVNGILTAKPRPSPVKKKDSRASSALNAKINQAQEQRKPKKKK